MSAEPKPCLLEGSCHCGAVKFSVQSFTPYPFMICHCIADRKTSGFYNCNIMGQTDTLTVQGEEFLTKYQAKKSQTASGGSSDELSGHKRFFCGSSLWAHDDRWKDWVYPFASAIDTPLPVPPEEIHIMCEFKAPHIRVPPEAKRYEGYPQEGIEQWHKEKGLYGTYQPSKRRGNKSLTSILGITGVNHVKLLKALRQHLSCNGTITESEECGKVIQLQGDQREKVMAFLINNGIVSRNAVNAPGIFP